MLAVDLDEENTPNSQVLYFLISQTPLLKESGFQVDRISGEIRLSGCLDYEVMWILLFFKMKCVAHPWAPGLDSTFVVGNPLWLDLLLKLLKQNMSLLMFSFPIFEGLNFPFPPHIDCSSVYTANQSQGLWRTVTVIHGHRTHGCARRQQPQAHIYPGEREPPGPPRRLSPKTSSPWVLGSVFLGEGVRLLLYCCEDIPETG